MPVYLCWWSFNRQIEIKWPTPFYLLSFFVSIYGSNSWICSVIPTTHNPHTHIHTNIYTQQSERGVLSTSKHETTAVCINPEVWGPETMNLLSHISLSVISEAWIEISLFNINRTIGITLFLHLTPVLRSAVRRRVLFSDPQTDRDFVRKYVANLEEARLSDCNVDNHIFSDFLKSGFDGSDFPKNRVLLSRIYRLFPSAPSFRFEF